MFAVEDGRIKSQEIVDSPPHRPGYLPVFLEELGAEVVIAGGMGGGAVDLFREKGIETITGAVGDVQAAALAWLKGELKSAGSVCHEHQHADSCGH